MIMFALSSAGWCGGSKGSAVVVAFVEGKLSSSFGPERPVRLHSPIKSFCQLNARD